MNFIPHGDYVLCTQVTKGNKQVQEDNLTFDLPELPTYRIVKLSDKIKKDIEFAPGDVIVINSQPTKMKDSEQEFLLVNLDNIAGKLSW